MVARTVDASTALRMLSELSAKHEQLQSAYNQLAGQSVPVSSSEAVGYNLHNSNSTCIQPNHAESPGNEIVLTAMIVIVTGIIIVTITFEYAKEEWERRMHASLKAVVKNVFCTSIHFSPYFSPPYLFLIDIVCKVVEYFVVVVVVVSCVGSFFFSYSHLFSHLFLTCFLTYFSTLVLFVFCFQPS